MFPRSPRSFRRSTVQHVAPRSCTNRSDTASYLANRIRSFGNGWVQSRSHSVQRTNRHFLRSNHRRLSRTQHLAKYRSLLCFGRSPTLWARPAELSFQMGRAFVFSGCSMFIKLSICRDGLQCSLIARLRYRSGRWR